ncbi:MAG: hypothetical protein IJC73_09210 [Lentisphaeria bacterium]|nr:hypothetical protein [Lentisphaeria bacterium]
MIRSYLVHLSMNMWNDNRPAERFLPNDGSAWRENMPEHYHRIPHYRRDITWHDSLSFNETVWRQLLSRMVNSGINTIFLDVGDAVVFRSHPEIAVDGAWSPRKLKEELQRCRDLGLAVYPKLNFSSCHDAWLRQYSRMLSTPLYYQVCRDLIAETAELFDAPPHFHIGMDEEGYACQKDFDYIVIRRNELWWSDLNFYFDEVARAGCRPWMWSDKLWHDCDPAEFARNVPRNVVQNNWYYWADYSFPEDQELTPHMKDCKKILECFVTLDQLGYDQVPTGSDWASPYNYERLVPFCTQCISPEHLLGFMTAPWASTTPENMETLFDSCDQVARTHAK